MTLEEIQKMMSRKHAAQNVLKFFKEIKSITNPDLRSGQDYEDPDASAMLNSSGNMSQWVVTQSAAEEARVGIENGCEKMSICYTSLASNPMLTDNSSVIMFHPGTSDYPCLLITDKDIGNKDPFYMRELSNTTIVVDVWSDDWYFPNLSAYDTFINHLVNLPDPLQYILRRKIKEEILNREHSYIYHRKKGETRIFEPCERY